MILGACFVLFEIESHVVSLVGGGGVAPCSDLSSSNSSGPNDCSIATWPFFRK